MRKTWDVLFENVKRFVKTRKEDLNAFFTSLRIRKFENSCCGGASEKKNKSIAGAIYKTKRKFQTACHLSRCEYEAPSTTQLHLPKENTWKRCFPYENTSNVYRPHYAWDKRIRKRCAHSENASWSRVLLPFYAGETWKQKFDFKESSGSSHIIILNSSFRNSSFSTDFFFLFAFKRKAGVFKFLRFQERFWKASIKWRISIGGGPNRIVSHYNVDVI